MATLPPVDVPARTMVDINAATGIGSGLALQIQNVLGGVAWLIESTLEPDFNVVSGDKLVPDEILVNDAGAEIVWAYSSTGCTLQVGVAP